MGLDLITAEVIRGSLESIAEDMGITMTRTSRSPIFNEVHDFSTAIFDYDEQHRARMVAQAPALFVHIYATLASVDALLKEFRYDLHEGDIILLNDPYFGGSHSMDYTMMKPVFVQNRPIMFTAVRAHMADTGGGVAGGYNPSARDIWQEGLRIPPIKLYERGEPKRDVLDWIKANNRLPDMLEGDLNAMVAACKVGERRIKQLFAKYGLEEVKRHIDYAMDYAEKRTRAEITRWPDGAYEGVSYLEHDCAGTKEVKVKVKVIIEGDDLTFDFTGSDRTVPGFVNSTISNTYSYVLGMLTTLVSPDIPKNEGLFRPCKFILPDNTVVNARFPAATGYDTLHVGSEIGEALAKALEQAIPDKVTIMHIKFPFTITFGVDPRNGQFYISLNFPAIMTGCGGTFGHDGWGGFPTVFGGLIMPTIEMSEVQYPLMYLSHEFIVDSCGAGQWRGGMGHETYLKNIEHVMFSNVMVQGNRHPLPGIAGGKEGPINELRINCDTKDESYIPDTAFMVLSQPGSIVQSRSGGGGGWGNPLERDPEKVREDVLDEYITAETARGVYSVILDHQTLELDEGATEDLRERKRVLRRY